MKHKFLLVVLLMLFACACSEKRYVEPFVQGSGEIGLVQRGKTLFSYNKSTCQLAFNRERCTFRVQTDDMQDFFTLTLSEMPSSVGQTLTGNLTWTTTSEVNLRKDVAFEVKKIEDDTFWLWASSGSIGAIVRALD